MRFLPLAFLLTIATTSCELGGASLHFVVSSNSAASASLGLAERQNRGECGFAFALTNALAKRQFLSEISGLWRDHLSAAELRPGATGRDNAVLTQDGLEANQDQMAIVRVRLQMSDEPGSVDGYRAIGALEGPKQMKLISIGPTLLDQSRVVQFSAHDGCETYSFRTERLADGSPVLLVRGPIYRSLGEQTQSLSHFDELTRDQNRLWIRAGP